MKIIVQTVELVTVCRSYEVEAEGVIEARRGSLDGLTPLHTRQISHRNEHAIGAARRSYLDEVSGRLETYICCENED